MLPKPSIRNELPAAARYVLAPGCVGAALLLHVSPAGPYLHPTGLLLLGLVCAAWFGGLGPALVAALLATLALPRLTPVGYPLLADLLDLPHFVIFGLTGAALGWGGARRRLAERRRADQEARESATRYERVMLAADAGLWDWDVAKDEFQVSPRLLELCGLPPGTVIGGREDFVRRNSIHPEDKEVYEEAVSRLFAGSDSRLSTEVRVIIGGETQWRRFAGICFRDEQGRVVRWTGSTTDITARKHAEEALRESEQRYERVMLAADAGFWDWDVAKDEFHVSPRMLEISGLQPSSTVAGREDFIRRAPFHPEDLDKWRKAVKELFASGGSRLAMDMRYFRHGELAWCRLDGMCFRDKAGRVLRWTGSSTDITERKRAEKELRESEARFRGLTELWSDWYWQQDEHLRFTYSSAATNPPPGYPGGVAAGKTRWELDGIVPLSSSWAEHRAALAARKPFRDFEYSRPAADGTLRYLSTSGAPIFDEKGEFRGYYGVARDITARKRIEEALRESQERYALAVAGSDDGIWDWDLLTGSMFVSERAQRIFGLEPGPTERLREEWHAMIAFHPEDHRAQRRMVEEYLSGALPYNEGEWRLRSKDGGYRWIRIRSICLRNSDGKPVRMAGSVSDIDAQKKAEASLRLSEERYAIAMDVTEEGHVDWNAATQEFFVSEQAKRVLNVPLEVQYRSREDLMGRVPYHPDDLPRVSAAWRASLAGSEAEHELEYRIMRGATPSWIRSRWKIFRDADGRAHRVVGVVRDITERKQAVEVLRESETRARTLVELNSSGYWEQDENFRFTPIAFPLDISGYPTSDRVGKTRWELPGDVTPVSGSWREHQADCAAHRPIRDFEMRRVRANGEVGYYSVSGAPIFDKEGRFKGYYGVSNDITKRKRIEAKLRQAQRLESMGTMAGGIAHDFNNILGAIVGYGEMALRAAKKGTRLRRDLDAIMSAGERGRALVDRILAFSRSGVGERVPVHVEEVVREALDQLAAKLPGNVTIAPRLRAGRAAMLGDSTQVHQVVMNLANNAAQAMPDGGVVRVTLEAVRLEAARSAMVGTVAQGDYIVLKVSDAGTGIAPKVLEHMFDPFFTTKEIGVGTGLGLSLVHGIVVSVGGAIDVATELGKGSTFTVYLPQSGDAPAKVVHDERPLPRGNGQRVLVVDDEEPLVRLATETLAHLGYAPVPFTSSAAALAAFRADPQRFDAVLTDERMPGLSGTALIREVRGIRDTIPVVLMSGYLGMEAPAASVVVRKPLSAGELAASLARALHP